jgi:hypothetical protein
MAPASSTFVLYVEERWRGRLRRGKMMAIYIDIDDVIETIKAMTKSMMRDDQGYTLTNCEALERQDHNETVRQIAEKITNKFKLGIQDDSDVPVIVDPEGPRPGLG